MKTKSSNFKAFICKALLIITCITVAFAGYTTCNAQTIEGKWKATSVKTSYTDEGVKSHGKLFRESIIKNGSVEYKSDHTITLTSSTGIASDGGTWSLTGDQLKQPGLLFNLSFNGNTVE